jgi:putative Holliday junction resolvase
LRALGIDLGSRRIGVALSDSDGRVATPYEVVERSSTRARDHARIAALVSETGAEVVVVGMPFALDGSIGPAAAGALEEVDELRRALAVPVATHDERLTTVTAERDLRTMRVKGRARRRVVDKVAATVLLQSWLDGRAARTGEDHSA